VLLLLLGLRRSEPLRLPWHDVRCGQVAGHEKDQRENRWSEVVARGGVEPPTFRFSVGRSYQLSYLAVRLTSRTFG
jgi:hypothetical protein